MNGKCNWMRMSLNSSTRSPISTIASKHSKPEKPDMFSHVQPLTGAECLKVLSSASGRCPCTSLGPSHLWANPTKSCPLPRTWPRPQSHAEFPAEIQLCHQKRQSPCVLGAGGLGQSADDFLCPDFTRCKFQMIVDYHTLIHTIWINMIQYGSIR